jgi:hypothetical protein
MNKYISSYGEMGVIDTVATQEQHFKKLTQQDAWRYFKLVGEDGTSFVTFICKHCIRGK